MSISAPTIAAGLTIFYVAMLTLVLIAVNKDDEGDDE